MNDPQSLGLSLCKWIYIIFIWRYKGRLKLWLKICITFNSKYKFCCLLHQQGIDHFLVQKLPLTFRPENICHRGSITELLVSRLTGFYKTRKRIHIICNKTTTNQKGYQLYIETSPYSAVSVFFFLSLAINKLNQLLMDKHAFSLPLEGSS